MSTIERSSPVWLMALSMSLVLPSGGLAQSLGDHTYSSADIEAGSRLYVSECRLCHGAFGNSVDGVDLRLGQFRQPLSDDGIRQVITTGIDGERMPSFDLGTEQLNQLVAFIRAGFDPEGTAVRVGDASQGQVLFEGEGGCTECHRINGQGPRAAPDLSDIGAIRSPAALQRALLDPYTALLPINRPVRIVMDDGDIIMGRRLNEDTYSVQMIDSQERLRSLVKSQIVDYEISRDPTMDPTTLSSDQVADVIGYLLSLRGLR